MSLTFWIMVLLFSNDEGLLINQRRWATHATYRHAGFESTDPGLVPESIARLKSMLHVYGDLGGLKDQT